MITKTESGKWRVDLRLSNGVRKRKTFRTQAEAKQFLHFAKSQGVNDPWVKSQVRDKRTLSELIHLWFDAHGSSLSSGVDRKNRLLNFAKENGDPYADDLNAEMFIHWRSARLANGTSENTVNHDLAHLRALYNELERMGLIKLGNPLSRVRTLKVVPVSLCTLTNDQIRSLLIELKDKPAELVMMICLSIGARWSEAQNLTSVDLIEPNLIRLLGKNNKYRYLPVSKSLFDRLRALPSVSLFPRVAYEQFRRAVEKLQIDLPEGQLTHVLRHTFATTFLKETGDLKALQVLLDHSNIAVTSRYLHAMPDHAARVLYANPLAVMTAD